MIRFYGEELLAPRPTPKMEGHHLSAVRDSLFNIFAATLHIGGRSSIRNLRTRHVLVKGTHLSRPRSDRFMILSQIRFDIMITCVAHSMLTGDVKYILVLKCQQILADDEINRETGSTVNRIRSAQAHNMLTAVAEM